MAKLNSPPMMSIRVMDMDNMLIAGTDQGIYWYADDQKLWYNLGRQLLNTTVSKIVYDPRSKEIYATSFGRVVWKLNIEER